LQEGEGPPVTLRRMEKLGDHQMGREKVISVFGNDNSPVREDCKKLTKKNRKGAQGRNQQ